MDLRCWPSSVQPSNFLCPSLKHFATIGCCVKTSCSWTIGLCQRMVCQPIHWHDGFSSSWIDNQGLWQRCPSGLLKLAQVRIALLEEIDVCICQAGKTSTWLLGGEISRSLPLSATTLTTTNGHRVAGRTVLIPNNPVLCHFLLWSNKEFDVCLGWCLSSHAVEFGNMFDRNTPVTVSHGFLLSRRFHHENIILLRVTFQIVHSCCPLLLPTFAWSVPTFTVWPPLFDCPTFAVILTFAVSVLSLSFCFSTFCTTELGRMTWLSTVVADAVETSTFALGSFTSLQTVQLTIWTSWCVSVANVPILSPLWCVLTVVQIWVTVRTTEWTWRGALVGTVGTWCQCLSWCNVSNIHWCSVLFLMKARTSSSKLWGSTLSTSTYSASTENSMKTNTRTTLNLTSEFRGLTDRLWSRALTSYNMFLYNFGVSFGEPQYISYLFISCTK